MARSRMIEVGDVNAALEGYVPEESFLGGWMLATSLPPATSRLKPIRLTFLVPGQLDQEWIPVWITIIVCENFP